MTDLSKSTGFSEKLTYNLINATGRALTNTAINGGNLEETLKQALIGGIVDTAHGQAASQIKAQEFGDVAHKLAHALAGCVAGAAAGGACKDGAVGAAVGEIVAEMFDKQRPGMFASAAEKQAFNAKVLGYSKLVAGAVSAYAGGNAQTAITTAETAVTNNFLTYNKYNSRASQWGSFKQELDTCKATAGCDVNNVYSRWTVISNDQQKQAMASLDGLFAANPSDASTAGQWFGKAISSMYMQATDVCSATDARCMSFVQSQQSQAMAVYRTGVTLAYANDMVDGGGRLRSTLLEEPTTKLTNAQSVASTQKRDAAIAYLNNNFYKDGGNPTDPVMLNRMFGQIAEASTHNSIASEVVLGKYIAASASSYEKVAISKNATYFDVKDWNTAEGMLTTSQMWGINKAFLDQQIKQGKTFVFTSDPNLIDKRSYTWKEFDYLANQGYTFNQEVGGTYRAVKK